MRTYILEYASRRGYLITAIEADGSRSIAGKFNNRTDALKDIRALRKADSIRMVQRGRLGHVVSPATD